jgi:hypothetical protein
MTSENTNPTVPVRTRSVAHQVNYGQLISMLSTLPQDAILYGDLSGESDNRHSPFPVFEFRPYHYQDWDVQFDIDYSREPVTVGDFLTFLLLNKGRPIPYNENYLITDETYVFINETGGLRGAIDGIRMNEDGSFSLSASHPFA